MAKVFELLKQHLAKYVLFYTFATLFLAPVYLEMIVLCIVPYKALHEVGYLLLVSYVAVMLVVIAVGIKKVNHFSRVVSYVVLFFGFVCQVASFIILYRHDAFHNKFYTMIFLVMIFLYFVWVAIYFLTDSPVLFERNRRPTKKGAAFLVLMAVFFFAPFYFRSDFYSYLMFEAHSNAEVESWIMSILSGVTLYILVVFFIFLYVYRIIRKTIFVNKAVSPGKQAP